MMGVLLDAFFLAPARAIAFLRGKKLRISGSWTQVWREQHARAFTVANLAKLDLLQDIRNMLDAAIAGEVAPDSTGEPVRRGITFQQFKKDLVPRLKARGWWGYEETVNPDTGEVIEKQLGSVRRLRTIFQTNVQSAYQAGRYRGQMESVNDLPYWQYDAVMDGSTTAGCQALGGKVFRADDPVWDTIYPPNHFNCRSRVRALTERQVARDRLDVESSQGRMTSKTEVVGMGDNQRPVSVQGLRITEPDGSPGVFCPGPGWDYNAGKVAFKPDLKRYDPDIAALFEEGE